MVVTIGYTMDTIDAALLNGVVGTSGDNLGRDSVI